MASGKTDLTTLIAELGAADVKFVLVEGLAAVAQGAPITTFDVDIVHARDEQNVDALLRFLGSVHARYRGRPKGELLPASRTALLGPGHSLFTTDLGPLDVLGAIEGARAYEDLVHDSLDVEVEGHVIKVLKLATLVELKRGLTNMKNRHVLPILEATLRRSDEK